MSVFAPNFQFEELTYSANHPELVPENRVSAQKYIDNLLCTSWGLQSIRDMLGKKMHTSSGFRFPPLNKAVKGGANSKHQLGKCWDGRAEGISVAEFFEFLMKNKSKIKNLKKVIIEGIHGKEWLHIEFEEGWDGEVDFYATTDGKNYERVV